MMIRASSLTKADLHLEPPVVRNELIEFACRLELSNGKAHRLWYRFPAAQQPLLTTRADPFVIAVLIYAMRHAHVLRVHGGVSAELLPNLDEFQHAFSAFQPGALRVVPIEAQRVEEYPAGPRRPRGISAFSAGVDGTFSIWRHTHLSGLRPKRPLQGALLMQGFDTADDDHATFARVIAKCRALTDEAGIALYTGSTNIRRLPLIWDQQFGPAVAASLSFFQCAYTFGIVPSSYSFRHLHLENGSNPLSDPLLSSAMMTIIHDGASYGRIDKLRAISAWPAAMENLRVCWQGGRAVNCCRCEKCIRTMLMLQLCGVERCAAFPHEVTPQDLDRLTISTAGGVNELAYLLEEARRAGRRDPWMAPLAGAIVRNRRYLRLQAAARGMVPFGLRTAFGSFAKRVLGHHPPRLPDPEPVPLIARPALKSSS